MNSGKTCPLHSECDTKYCSGKEVSFVDDNEVVLRMLFYPKHIGENGKPKESAFALVHFQKKTGKGYSVDRKAKCNAIAYGRLVREVERKVRLRVPESRIQKVAIGVARDLRAIDVKDNYFFICPSATAKRPSHADIWLAASLSQSVWNDIRDQLTKSFKIVPPNQVYIEAGRTHG